MLKPPPDTIVQSCKVDVLVDSTTVLITVVNTLTDDQFNKYMGSLDAAVLSSFITSFLVSCWPLSCWALHLLPIIDRLPRSPLLLLDRVLIKSPCLFSAFANRL